MNRAKELRRGRRLAGLTQAEAARRLGISQPYLSLLENGKRPLFASLARKAARLYPLPATVLPPALASSSREDPSRLARQLSGLGYPGYEYMRSRALANPADVVLDLVSRSDVDSRLTRAVPWVLSRYPNLDWQDLVREVKLRNAQNRLGFLVTLAREVAERTSNSDSVEKLRKVEEELDRSRLVAETTLGRESMPESERAWLRTNRPSAAQRWNVLTSLTSDEVLSASAA